MGTVSWSPHVGLCGLPSASVSASELFRGDPGPERTLRVAVGGPLLC